MYNDNNISHSGLGKLVHIFPGDRPVRMALNYSGHIPEKSKEILMDFPLNRVNQLSCLHQKHSSSQQTSVAMVAQSSVAMEIQSSDSSPMVQESLTEKNSDPCDSHVGGKLIPNVTCSETGSGVIGNGDEEQENTLDDSLLAVDSDEGSSQLEDEDEDGMPASKRLKTSTEEISQEVC